LRWSIFLRLHAQGIIDPTARSSAEVNASDLTPGFLLFRRCYSPEQMVAVAET
jgi:hypothetical protein